MKKLALLALLATALAGGGSPGFAAGMHGGFHGNGGGMHSFRGHSGAHGFHHFHGHGRIFFFIGDPFGPPVYVYPPPVYVEDQPYYWYCPDPSGYWPDIQSCNARWLRVIPEEGY